MVRAAASDDEAQRLAQENERLRQVCGLGFCVLTGVYWAVCVACSCVRHLQARVAHSSGSLAQPSLHDCAGTPLPASQNLSKMLAALPPEQRAALEQQHAALREEARSAGLEIPALGATQAGAQRPAEPAAGAEPAPAEAEAAAEAAVPPPPPPPPASPWESLADKLGVKARVEEGDSGEFVFRFGAADSETGGWHPPVAPCAAALWPFLCCLQCARRAILAPSLCLRCR